MLYGAILRAPVEDSAPAQVDDAAARAVPGVMRIVRLPFGVGVIAETPWAAFAAKDALRVTWDRRGTGWGFDSDAAIARYAAAARDLTTPGKPWDKVGDVSAATAKAATVLEAEFSSDYAYHAQMEPLNSVASVSPAGDACEIWVGSQGQTMAVAAVAKALGIPPVKVRLNNTLLGGGFGRRGHRDEEFVVDSVLLSKEVRRPVKLMWTREDDVKNGRFRPMSVHFMRAGLDASGRIVAWQHRRHSWIRSASRGPCERTTSLRSRDRRSGPMTSRIAWPSSSGSRPGSAPLPCAGSASSRTSSRPRRSSTRLPSSEASTPLHSGSSCSRTPRAGRRWSPPSSRCRSTGAHGPAGPWASRSSTTRTRWWRAWRRSRSTVRRAGSECTISGARSIPALPSSRTTSSRRRRARSSMGSGSPSPSASP
ncbi:MAG: hypothetical protein DMD99_26870 [Candidatus Rokuibacteriota bacterium]|nr:MAG: hypothetical protein DMD99_26870 [Candidatus Rokubacteria bacterium]